MTGGVSLMTQIAWLASWWPVQNSDCPTFSEVLVPWNSHIFVHFPLSGKVPLSSSWWNTVAQWFETFQQELEWHVTHNNSSDANGKLLWSAEQWVHIQSRFGCTKWSHFCALPTNWENSTDWKLAKCFSLIQMHLATAALSGIFAFDFCKLQQQFPNAHSMEFCSLSVRHFCPPSWNVPLSPFCWKLSKILWKWQWSSKLEFDTHQQMCPKLAILTFMFKIHWNVLMMQVDLWIQLACFFSLWMLLHGMTAMHPAFWFAESDANCIIPPHVTKHPNTNLCQPTMPSKQCKTRAEFCNDTFDSIILPSVHACTASHLKCKLDFVWCKRSFWMFQE